MKIKSIGIFITLCIIIISCSYDEGEMLAEEAFSKMSTRERILYNSVAENWTQNYLVHIRNAVRERHVKPKESTIPFQDISEIIMLNNNATLKLSSQWSEDYKKRMKESKWSEIDPSWYNTIVEISNGGEKKEEQKKISKPKKSKNSPPKNIKIVSSNQDNGYISIDDLNELRYEIRGCSKAAELFNSIVLKGEPLTYSDRDKIEEKILICVAEKINNKIKEE